MNCERAREAISALIDDEDPGVPVAALREHLGRCPACATWQQAAVAAPRLAAAEMGPSEDGVRDVLRLVAAERRAQHERSVTRQLRPWRAGLVAVAVIQPALVLTSLLSEHWLHHTHTGRELGAWHVALALGFLFAAVRPARAWGMLPLVAAIVTGLVVTAGVDLAEGHVGVAEELAHAVDLVGLGFLWGLSARLQRPVGRLRLA